MGSIAMPEQAMSEASSSPSDTLEVHTQLPATNKRTSADAGLKTNGMRPAKSVKRRASKACQCCRARKVRCNVVEHGPPCTNCRLDEVECIVSESKRKKKWTTSGIETSSQTSKSGLNAYNPPSFPMKAQPPYEPLRRSTISSEHVPHSLYQDLGRSMSMSNDTPSMYTPDMLMNLQRLGQKPAVPDPTPLLPNLGLAPPVQPTYSLPMYIKPLPSKLDPEDIMYLGKKGALQIPSQQLRDELLRNYVEFVHPFMPLLNIHDLVSTIDRNNGSAPVSLLLFQAIMFSAIATVDIRYLKAAGYATRRDARRAFFTKTRLLYDFDIEIDRISLIQSLLLMTYWYETPDDQKDSHHWMGIAVSLSHTIGLHRNPEKSAAMDSNRKKLWKRIWWSTYMRDRLVALGMRRPTRIKNADFDVPMMDPSDFEDAVLPEGPSCIPADCKILRDREVQKQLAIMCIEKAKLCVCMSHVLSVQYSVLNNNHGVLSEEGSTKTTVHLVARARDPETTEVQTCDRELQQWRDELPEEAKYVIPNWHDVDSGKESMVLNRSLLHMIYYATLSALHRPQVLPSTAMPPRPQVSEQLDHSRKAVRLAASEITSIAYRLFNLDMVRFLPTTGITTLLPAIIIHLLDIKAPDEGTRRGSLQGFCQCMQVMGKLRDIYAAADYSTAFLEAAIRKAEIVLPQKTDEVKEPRNVITSAQGLVDAGKRLHLVDGCERQMVSAGSATLTPPPDSENGKLKEGLRHGMTNDSVMTDDDMARKLSSYLASTPPDSDGHSHAADSGVEGLHNLAANIAGSEFEPDFDSLINLDAAGDVWSLEDGAYAAMSGECGGFALDVDWLKGMKNDEGLGSNSHIAAITSSPTPAEPTSPPVAIVHHAIVTTHPPIEQTHQRPLSPPTLASTETRLPPPRTPASVKSRDNPSEYLTAPWGSPYDRHFSPSTKSAHTALSKQQSILSDELDHSPSLRFGLEHLVPSRLADLSLLPGPNNPPLGIDFGAADHLQTPRSRTQRWVQLPQREGHAERALWSSDESVRSQSDGEDGRPRGLSEHKQRRLRHKAREENRTLDQQSFWDTLREGREEDMSSLFASRWAATPEPVADHPLQLPHSADKQDVEPEGQSESESESQPNESLSSRWAATPPVASRWADTPEPEEQEQNLADQASAAPQPSDDIPHVLRPGAGAAHTQASPHARPVSTLEPPRLKKRVSWRGKNIVISIPHFDYKAVGLVRPMSREEIGERMKRFEHAGYNTNGYDLLEEHTGSDGPAQVRPIYPDEREARFLPPRNQIKVVLPDLERWKAYENFLVEQKLAALGVDLGFDEPPAPLPPLQQPRSATQDMSRQSSAHYPPLPFSPPIPSASAGSMGRAPMMRGHTHAMSVASPASPMNGPFGHMHRHSTFTGGMGLPHSFSPARQQQPHSPNFQQAQPFSPIQQIQSPFGQAGLPQPMQQQLGGLQGHMQSGLPGLPRGGSPAQLAALRNDLGAIRGPGSPWSQQVLPGSQQYPAQSPADYSRQLLDDQRRRQHVYSQSMAAPSMPNSFFSQGSSVRPTPALPELAEDDEEDEIQTSELPAYVPPHKRVQANTEIAVPTPRGHRHNISEGLEREILEAEKRQKAASRDWIEVTEEEERPSCNAIPQPNDKENQPPPKPIEKDPLGDHPVQEALHSHKRSSSRFNVTAPAFNFNPAAEFKPQATEFKPPATLDFNFRAPVPMQPRINGQTTIHSRHRSSGSFNAAAPAFKPTTSDFSFSATAPKSDTFKYPVGQTVIDELPKIFGKVEIPDIVKPARRSKAVPIVKPTEADSEPEKEHEDEEGRVAQGEAKRRNKARDDGNSVPLFAEPTPMPSFPVVLDADPVPAEKILGSNVPDQQTMATVDEVEEEAEEAITDFAEKGAQTVSAESKEEPSSAELAQDTAHEQKKHGHKHSNSLSAFAKPFDPTASSFSPTAAMFDPRVKSFDPNAASFVVSEPEPEPEAPAHAHERLDSISDLEEGEIREDDDDGSRSVSPVQQYSAQDFGPKPILPGPRDSQERIGTVTQAEPSFDEIDAVMQHLNAWGSEREPDSAHLPHSAIGSEREPTPVRLPPNATESERETIPARMPSPGSHPMAGVTYLAERYRSDAPSPSPLREESKATPQLGSDQGLNGYANVRQLNKAEEIPTSDWSDMVSPPDVAKLEQRSTFFDGHIDKLIGRAVERRLQPLEESLRSISMTISRRNRSSELKLARSSSNVDSDADDEDELSDELKNRPISRGRDKRVDQIKLAVLEALREQSPKRSQQAIDIADLHSVLADMKVSFARAASSSLELDDIRAVVEATMSSQSQAVVPHESHDHKRQLSELEGRLNETLAGALEEANQRRAIEEQEKEAKRQLRLAEEEMQLLRAAARDDEAKLRAMEKEREDLLDRFDRVDEARRKAEERFSDTEAEKEALQATLEEYRTSSHKWRADIDEGKRVREELESTIAMLTRQAEDYEESTVVMKRRLEKLHTDMSTAAGQLSSEKAIWKSREEDYRSRIETLEHQNLVSTRERAQLEDELRIVRAVAIEAAETRNTMDHVRASNNSLEEMLRKLQGELSEQQAITARYERQFYDAQESGRAEVHRTRMAYEAEVEAANHQVNLVRAELEAELSKIRAELENAKMEIETMKERHEHLLEQEDRDRREALRKVNADNSRALDDARHKYESGIQELTAQHSRALRHALEDKDRVESLLNERLALSNARAQHYQERCGHLEERLEVVQDAARAAAQQAKASKAISPPAVASSVRSSTGLPEKISPQALRETILVLQEQLQERETRIERLEADLEEEGVQKVKARDDEIAWLRELLSVRGDELQELANTLQKPNFDRRRVQDIAIRIRTNLQMEQEEKERFGRNSNRSVTGQATALLSNFATPQAAKLTSAFGKWRTSMESSALKNAPRAPGSRSDTPSKASAPPLPSLPKGYQSGLMTPPASNIRSSPDPSALDKLPPPRLHSRTGSNGSKVSAVTERPRSSRSQASAGSERPRGHRTGSSTSGGPPTPLFREQSYDRDAEEGGAPELNLQHFEDDDTLDDIDESGEAPPGFRAPKSLEEEMGEPSPISPEALA
ncbi:hypothetical protein AC579_7936 [Pseudocercospora musae]|uniref:Zn(2)-C6 fungal-type domain-containing protein n=1 Tax=Pseudocercospora musae TaxID=113226 RepID=A0A139IKK4_9PEZI|nr:hypothetical protein AC579_7936 [Pseudocercospora musae]